MHLIAKSIRKNKTLNVDFAYFDIKDVLPVLNDELLVKVCLSNQKLNVMFSRLAKRQLSCYYVDLKKLEAATIKYIKRNPVCLIPPNYNNTEFDHVELKV